MYRVGRDWIGREGYWIGFRNAESNWGKLGGMRSWMEARAALDDPLMIYGTVRRSNRIMADKNFYGGKWTWGSFRPLGELPIQLRSRMEALRVPEEMSWTLVLFTKTGVWQSSVSHRSFSGLTGKGKGATWKEAYVASLRDLKDQMMIRVEARINAMKRLKLAGTASKVAGSKRVTIVNQQTRFQGDFPQETVAQFSKLRMPPDVYVQLERTDGRGWKASLSMEGMSGDPGVGFGPFWYDALYYAVIDAGKKMTDRTEAKISSLKKAIHTAMGV